MRILRLLVIPVLAAAAIVLGLYFGGQWFTRPNVSGDAGRGFESRILTSTAASDVREVAASDSPEDRQSRLRSAGLARREMLRREYRSAPDLAAFVHKFRAAADGGDSEAALAIADAISFCASWEATQAPVGSSARAARVAVSASSRDLMQTMEKRCDALSQEPAAELGAATDWLKKSAGDGNGAALYRLALQNPLHESVDARIEQFHRALASEDPDVLGAVVSMADADKAAPGAPGDPKIAMAGLEMARCDLGLDCSGSGVEFQVLCTQGDCARAAGAQDLSTTPLRPWEQDLARQYANGLLANLRSGRHDWPEALAVEQQIRGSATAGP